jgi:AcrR family transcriptional regulator
MTHRHYNSSSVMVILVGTMPLLERRRRNDPRREQTEAAFLAAATELLAEGLPFAELSVSVVADRAGRTRTAFYAHFEDRRELLLRLVEPLRADGRAAVAPFTEGDRDEGIGEAVAGLLDAMRRHRHVLRAVVEAATYDTEIDRFWNAFIAGFASANQARLERAGVPPAQAEPTAIVLTWMTERACTQQLRQESPAIADEQLIEALTDAWRRALGSATQGPAG